MSRTKRGVTSRARHKKVFKAVKGQWGRRKNTIRIARQAMEKAMQYAYRDRRAKKKRIQITLDTENQRRRKSRRFNLFKIH